MKHESPKFDIDLQDDLTNQEIVLSFIVELLVLLPVLLFIGWGVLEVSKIAGQSSSASAYVRSDIEGR